MNIHKINNTDMDKAYQIYGECFNMVVNHTLENNANLMGLYDKDNLIGIVQIDFINNIFDNKRIAYINSFCIAKDMQGKGYGDIFLKELIKYCKDNEADKINLTSNKSRVIAHKLYKKNNFEVIDTVFFKKELN